MTDDPRRDLLTGQLAIVWALAQEYTFGAVTGENAWWPPSVNACTVRDAPGGGWQVDMPDEGADPIPETTIVWLLWHVDWWWANAARWLDGEEAAGPDAHPWAGDHEAAIASIRERHRTWLDRLARADLDAATTAPFPDGATVAAVAAWVNVELMKNVAEIGTLVRAHANRG